MKQTRKIIFFKKARGYCNGKVNTMYLSISKCFTFSLTHTVKRPGQECAKCDQILSLNKNEGDFITLCFQSSGLQLY